MNEPVTIVEIDRDVCTRSFGVAPCTATGTKCYNTWKTCADKPNYGAGIQTLRFTKPRADLPLSWDAIPSVKSTTATPTELNVGDVDASSGPLGKRAQASVTFQDHPTSDVKIDPYVTERVGNPFERGTFWGRLKARWPYAKGASMRIIDGYIGQAIPDMVRRSYLIDSIDGPDGNGRVTIRGVDPLRILDDKTSQAPKQSTGELAVALAHGTGPHTVTVSGDLLAQYPAAGTIRIGSELMTYTSRTLVSSNTQFNVVTRGTDGSTISEHEVESRVQTCIRYTDMNAWEVARNLIQTYAPAAYAYIDNAQWEAEADQWLDGFIVSAVISEPTGVNKLLAELCRDAQFFIWWDERTSKILLRAVRPPNETPVAWNDAGNILADSQSVKEKTDERISQIWYYYQPRDLSKKVDDDANYRKVRIRIDGDAESEREYGEPAVTKIFSRWVRTDAIVTAITTRLINRYRDTPFYLTISVDAKDRGIWVADVVDVTSRILTNVDGLPLSMRYQVISAQETSPGSVVKYVLQNYNFAAKYGFYMVPGAPIYSLATEEQKLSGAWYSDVDGQISGEDGYQYQ